MSSPDPLIALFLQELAGQIDQLEAALSQKKTMTMLQAVQSIRSGALLVKLDDLAEKCVSIEKQLGSALEGEREPDQELVSEIEQILTVARELSNSLGKGVPPPDEQDEEGGKVPSLGEEEEQEEEPEEERTPPKEESLSEEAPPIDASLCELFRTELEGQCRTLSDGLLALEEGKSDPRVLEELMRASHSAKGAARVVGLETVVSLAHGMEDVFVAAQSGDITFDEKTTDYILSCVDLLDSLRRQSVDEMSQWVAATESAFLQRVEGLQAILEGREIPKLAESAPARAKSTEPSKRGRERVLRVTASSLDRLMGLAGEALVESRWLQPFIDALMALKRHHNSLAQTVDNLRESLSEASVSDATEHYTKEAQHLANECRRGVSDRISEMEGFIRKHASLSDRLYREVIDSRMRPFSDGVRGFPRMVRDVARNLGKKVHLEIVGKATPVDRDILERLEAPLGHLLRNAIDHGIETPEERRAAGKDEVGQLYLEARHRGGMLAITVSDDGRGIDVEDIRKQVVERKLASQEMSDTFGEAELFDFLFLPGFSTTEEVTDVSGRGVGLDVVQTMVQDVGGTLRSVSKIGKGLTVHLQLPLTLSVIRALLCDIGGEPYAFPLGRLERVVLVERDDIQLVEDRQYFQLEEHNIGLVQGHQVLGLETTLGEGVAYPVVVVADRMSHMYGVTVDSILGERELVVQEIDRRLGKVANISSGACMENGEPVLILDVEDLVRSTDQILHGGRLQRLGGEAAAETGSAHKRILVVDDSITVREVECRLLRNAGYEVNTAVDGVDAWHALRQSKYDLVVTDIDMPRMNGIELVRKMRGEEKYEGIPIVIVSYKDRESDRVAGMEAGADYYLAKSSFHDERLLKAVGDLLGPQRSKRGGP